jgi:hypothetical protein
MKRFLTGTILATGIPGVAAAHTLSDGEGVIAQLWHELLGWHHLPFTLLLVVVGLVAWVAYRSARRQE